MKCIIAKIIDIFVMAHESDMLGTFDAYAPCVIQLTRAQRKLVELLLTREMVTEPLFRTFNGAYTEQLSHLRKKLRGTGIEISTAWGVGHYLTKANRAALLALMEQRP